MSHISDALLREYIVDKRYLSLAAVFRQLYIEKGDAAALLSRCYEVVKSLPGPARPSYKLFFTDTLPKIEAEAKQYGVAAYQKPLRAQPAKPRRRYS